MLIWLIWCKQAYKSTKLNNDGKEMNILGYANCGLKEKVVPDNNARHMLNIFELFSFKQLIEDPTRVNLDTSTIMDHIATTQPNISLFQVFIKSL